MFILQHFKAARTRPALAFAWSNSPRSREHLNALEDDLDAKYYSQAYVDDDTAIQMAVPAGSLVV